MAAKSPKKKPLPSLIGDTAKALTQTAKMSYTDFSVTLSDPMLMGGKCPLCATPLKANVEHRCSNGVPE